MGCYSLLSFSLTRKEKNLKMKSMKLGVLASLVVGLMAGNAFAVTYYARVDGDDSKDGKIVGGNGWGGYGRDSRWFGHFQWTHEETPDGWHHYGCDWSPKGYTFYVDGKKIGEQNEPVSHVPQFILVSTEPGGYRKVGSDGGLTAGRKTKVWGKPDPRLFQATLPDFFEVDFVRVYDEVAK